MSTTITARNLHVGYRGHAVIEGLDVELPAGRVTAIVGPNACGKSTLLRAIARLHPVDAGTVTIDGVDIAQMPRKQLATRLGVLPQSATAPDGIRVADLVARGRFPHQGWFGRHTSTDDDVVLRSLRATGVEDLADRRIEELSGGQRQRVWIAMVLAQETDAVLLDEPTTFLDMTHQLELLDLLADLNEHRGTTVVMVLHDLNQAARYAHHMVVMRQGRIVAQGTPADVLTPGCIKEAFGLDATVVPDPVTGDPMVVARGRTASTFGSPVS